MPVVHGRRLSNSGARTDKQMTLSRDSAKHRYRSKVKAHRRHPSRSYSLPCVGACGDRNEANLTRMWRDDRPSNSCMLLRGAVWTTDGSGGNVFISQRMAGTRSAGLHARLYEGACSPKQRKPLQRPTLGRGGDGDRSLHTLLRAEREGPRIRGAIIRNRAGRMSAVRDSTARLSAGAAGYIGGAGVLMYAYR